MEALGVLQTKLNVWYEDVEISTEVSADLLSCTYTDAIDDEADEVSITLMDPHGKWAGRWTPDRGAKISVLYSTENRGYLATDTMMIDELKTSGSPRVFEFRAVSIPLNNTIRRTIKTRNFENLTLQKIASQIASEAKLTLFWDSENNPNYDRIDQRQESDLAFLKRLCDEQGLTVKVANERLIIFDQASYEKKEPVKTLTLGTSPILSWSFSAQQSERYRKVTVKWRDIKQKTKVEKTKSLKLARTNAQNDEQSVNMYGTNYSDKNQKPKKGPEKTRAEYVEASFEDPSVEESGQTFILKKRCSSYAEAERLAKAKLRELNLRQTTGSLSLVGDPLMISGQVIAIKGIGAMDGNFIIERSTHSMTEQGYTTSIEVRRVNANY